MKFRVDGLIDANELSTVMNILKFPITDREANEMIDFADHDKGNSFILSFFQLNSLKDSLISFDEFLTIFTQISAMNTLSN